MNPNIYEVIEYQIYYEEVEDYKIREDIKHVRKNRFILNDPNKAYPKYNRSESGHKDKDIKKDKE